MTPAPAHYGDELQDLLDKRLDANVRRAVQLHLETCRDCRRRFEAFEWTKAALRRRSVAAAPEGLRGEIVHALRKERIEVELFSSEPRRWSNNLAIAIAVAILLGLAAVLAGLFRGAPPTLADLVMDDFRMMRRGDLALQVNTGSVAVVDAYFEGYEIPFRARVFDPDTTGLTPVGGRAVGPGDRIRTLIAYRDPAGRLLVCEMFEGGPADMPVEGRVRERGGLRFRVHREGDVAAVFWMEGHVVCSIVAETDSEQLLHLAASLARR